MDQLLTDTEAATYLGLSLDQLEWLVQSGRLQCVMVENECRLRRDHLEELLHNWRPPEPVAEAFLAELWRRVDATADSNGDTDGDALLEALERDDELKKLKRRRLNSGTTSR